jgi:hypothetical protein
MYVVLPSPVLKTKRCSGTCKVRPLLARVARWHFFQTKNTNLGKFLEGLAMQDVGILYLCMAIWSILRLFDIVLGHFVYFKVIWYIFQLLGMLHQEKIWQP